MRRLQLRINGIDLDPARNPAVLDTYTWDPSSALDLCRSRGRFLEECATAVGTAHCEGCLRGALVDTEAVPASAALAGGVGYFLLNLSDGQKVLVAVGPGPVSVPVETIGTLAGGKVAVIPVNIDTIKWYVTDIMPRYSPRAFGAVPRVGVGDRQTVTVWPGVIEALGIIGGPAETIQNSAYRELAPMDMILSPPSSEVTYLPGHGSLSIGHTGSSIQGFWLSGVISHIENGVTEPYGADLDHIPVKTGDAAGIAKAKYLIDCGRHFTFFTLDTSALFDFSKTDLSARYDAAIDAGVELYDYLVQIKQGEPFDYEFSLDEGPGITTPEELRYVLDRLTKKGVKVAFIAPNVGFEKRLDYRLPDGMPGLEARVKEMAVIAADYGALLDFHSGSDKSSLTYQTISKAAGGKIKLKVSGKLQLILSEVLADLDPEFFNEWWDYTFISAKAEADAGSSVAVEYVKMVEDRRQAQGAGFTRLPQDRFFTDFSFGMVGAKDEKGNFLHRDRFYSLKPEVQAEYTRRVRDYVVKLAEDLGVRRK
jgi:hypothetical protein